MSHGVPLLYWRNGRPRWEPGPSRRKKGDRGQDLKDADGNWLNFEDAQAKARQINAGFTVKQTILRRPLADRGYAENDIEGYDTLGQIYFVRFGSVIKIGFTTNFQARMGAICQGHPEPFLSFGAVNGTLLEEKLIHKSLAQYRQKGEWYAPHGDVLRFIANCVIRGKVAWNRLKH